MKLWRSLRWRFVGSYLVLALVLLSFAGYLFSNALGYYAAVVQKQQVGAYVAQAQQILADEALQGHTKEQTLQRLRQELPFLQIEQVTIADKVALVAPGAVMKLPTPLPGKNVFILGKPAVATESFEIATALVPGQAVTLRFTLREGTAAVLSALFRQVAAVLVLALALAGLAGWLLSRWLAGPLARLGAATQAVAEGDFLHTLAPTGLVEVDRLTDQFNRMVLRLRDSFRSLAAERDLAQRFAADAAHELKTPVTTLRAYHEVMQEHPERLEQVAPAVGRQIERMERVITGLLELARIGEGTAVHLEPGDAAAVLRDLMPGYQALAEENGLTFDTCGLADPLPVLLDRRLLELAVNNLVENACKYTPPGGQVTLTARREGDEAVVAVADTGKGIPPEELPYIFERFHRGVDTQTIPGTGLGLALAQEAVRRLGGSITAESAPGDGSRFTVRLPIAE